MDKIFKWLIRGYQYISHNLTMFKQLVKKAVFIDVIAFLLLFIITAWKSTSHFDRQLLFDYYRVNTYHNIKTNPIVHVGTWDGKTVSIRARRFIQSSNIKNYINNLENKAYRLLWYSLFATILLDLVLLVIVLKTGKKGSEDIIIRKFFLQFKITLNKNLLQR